MAMDSALPKAEAINKGLETTKRVYLTPSFKMGFWASLGFGAIAFVVLIVMAVIAPEPPTSMQHDVFELCKWMIGVSVGAFAGLIGGKVV